MGDLDVMTMVGEIESISVRYYSTLYCAYIRLLVVMWCFHHRFGFKRRWSRKGFSLLQ